MAVLHEGSLGQEVLAPGGEAEAEGEEPDADEDASHWVWPPTQYSAAVGGEAGQADAGGAAAMSTSARRGFLA